LSDAVAGDGVFETVRGAYQAVYDALGHSPTFTALWRANAYRAEFPEEFAHIGFLTLNEANRMLNLLGLLPLDPPATLVDLACGAGGPGLWAARESGASLIGIDPASSALVAARRRAQALGMSAHASFRQGTFAQTGLDDHIASAVMSVEAFQYAPDKAVALAELHRVLRPGGRLALICFEVDPAKVREVPVLGVDPVADYAPLLEQAGFSVDTYEETPGWKVRVDAAFNAIVNAREALTAEMGDVAAAGAITEAMLTVQVEPYPRRVLIVAAAE
jgi:SAM-dependent methyltransferase